MIVSKKLNITNLIIKTDNIRELAQKIYEEYEKDADSDKSINFILRGVDGTQYESDNKEIFSHNGILDTRRIIEIEMRYSNYTNDKRIYIQLSHTVEDYEWANYISVSGPDELWVNGVIKSFEDIISNWEKQVNWPHKYSRLLIMVFAVGIGLSFALLALNLLYFISTDVIIQPSYYVAAIGLGMFPAFYIIDKLKELYPVVELRTGPEYTQVEVRKRKKLYTIILLVVIPLVISLIIELIKNNN